MSDSLLGLHGGLVGVDVFFVISGYLITSLLIAEKAMTGRIDLFAFYARRFRRIFPAMILVVIATVVASCYLLSPNGEIGQAAESGAASLLFVANWYFQSHTGGYFDPSADRLPLLHLWSLGVEEQFYLGWPLGLIVLLRLPQLIAFRVVVVMAFASLALTEYLLLANPSLAFYQMPARLWELAMGGLVALSPARPLSDGRLPATVGVIVVLAATVVPVTHFPGVGALPAVCGATLLVYAVQRSRQLGWPGAMLRSKLFVFIGLISYSLYLWHWPLLALEKATHAGSTPISTRLMLCSMAVVLSWLSFRWVEQPLRRADAKTSAREIVGVGLIASVSIAYAVFQIGGMLDRTPPPHDLASRTSTDWPDNRFDCNSRGDEALDAFPKIGCIRPAGKPVRVAIWGDSHALAWQPFAWEIAGLQGVASISYVRDACPPVVAYDNGKHFVEAQRCRDFNNLVVNHLDGIQTLIVAALWPSDDRLGEFSLKFATTIREASRHVERVIVLGPTPYMRDSVPLCIASHDLSACSIARSEFDASSNAVRGMLRSLEATYSKVRYLELSDFFCNSESCPPVKDGYGLYWDTDHVSVTAARACSSQYVPRFIQDLRSQDAK